MQSVTQQQADPGHPGDHEVRKPTRPEPFVSDRLSAFREIDFTGGREKQSSGAGSRFELAEAFRKMGRGAPPGVAFDRARDFFRSGGHAWTHGLSR